MGKKVRKASNATCAASTSDICPVLEKVRTTVEWMYDLPHNTAADDPVAKSPIDFGGTFKQIANRAWEHPETLLRESLDLLIECEIVDKNATLDTLGAQFLTIDWPPKQGQVIDTSVLSYSFGEASIKRGNGILKIASLIFMRYTFMDLVS